VATDLGLSRLNVPSQAWEHYLPDPAASPPMRKTSCSELYTGLLKILPKPAVPESGFEGFYNQLFNDLARFRPRFLQGYVKTKPPAERGCADIQFLAKEIKDFKTLKTELLMTTPIASPDFECLLRNFGGKESRDPAWRDYLLFLVAAPGDKSRLYEIGLLEMLAFFPGDSKVGEAFIRLLKTEENPLPAVRHFPKVLGKKGVPVLIESIDRFQEDIDLLHSIGDALGETTRFYLSIDGTIQPLPPGDTGKGHLIFSKDLFITQWKVWWKAHKSKYPP
jgi:hypothetical protein